MDFKFNKCQKRYKDTVESNRFYGYLDFQFRILSLVNEKTPILDQVNFVKIVYDNLKDFIRVRLPEFKDISDLYIGVDKLNSLFNLMKNVLSRLNEKYKISLENNNGTYFTTISHNPLEYPYSEECDYIKDKETLETLKPLSYSIITTGYIDIEEGHQPLCKFYINRDLIRIKDYCEAYKLKYPNKKFKGVSLYTEIPNYAEFLDENKFKLIRCPYDSYMYVYNFIKEMCLSPNTDAIFITLYRTDPYKKHTIVDLLKKAGESGKKVFVYIEIHARGDEKNNLLIKDELLKSNVNVKTDYLGYKVHGKIFLAVTKDNKSYAHIGTGNYNEATAKSYTDIHLISSEKKITDELTRMFIAIFEKKIFRSLSSNELIYSAPINFRIMIGTSITAEMRKGKNGRIWIKCNNLYDEEIMDLLYQAAQRGVNIYIICRTYCALKPDKNIHIRSKVGYYLEHDRMYIFGSHAYISSADLLFRNMSKRFEILCEADLKTLEGYFKDVWNRLPIHELTLQNTWRLLE